MSTRHLPSCQRNGIFRALTREHPFEANWDRGMVRKTEATACLTLIAQHGLESREKGVLNVRIALLEYRLGVSYTCITPLISWAFRATFFEARRVFGRWGSRQRNEAPRRATKRQARTKGSKNVAKKYRMRPISAHAGRHCGPPSHFEKTGPANGCSWRVPATYEGRGSKPLERRSLRSIHLGYLRACGGWGVRSHRVAMVVFQPICVGTTKAAKLLDMKPSEFRDLVRAGVLPNPRLFGKLERWDVEQLKAIASGNTCDDAGQIDW